MKTKGIVRKVDELGRVVIPIEIRRVLDIAEKDQLEICVEGDSIILRKHQRSCVFCASEKNIREYKGKYICAQCLSDISGQDW